MVRYKVVTEDRRSVVAGGKYELLYAVGEIVEAPPDTLGIFVFSDFWSAEKFVYGVTRDKGKPMIIKVNSIHEKTKPKYVSTGIDEKNIDKFYKFLNYEVSSCGVNDPIRGTICCEAVEVLE